MKGDHSKKRSEAEFSYDLHSAAGFGALYDAYAVKIWSHIFMRIRLREEANDLSSQVFFKTWEYVKKGNSITNVKSFLYRTADNAIIDWSRANKNVASIDESIEESGNEPAYHERFEEATLAKDQAQGVYEKLALLSEKERSLLLMRFVEEFEIEEIAQILGKSTGAIAVAVHRALKHLQSHIHS